MSPFDLTLAISIIVMAAYAANGIRLFDPSQSFEKFFLNNRLLTSENVRNTFAGAAVSISTVLLFFLTLGVLFGYQIFWSPFTLVLGVLVFAKAVYDRIGRRPELKDALRGEGERPIQSLGDFVGFLYGSPSLSKVVSLLSALGIMAILVAEMMVGVSIYEDYFVKPEYIVFIIAATLFLYAAFGGIQAVVETDRWQVRLILASLTAIILVLLFQEHESPGGGRQGLLNLFDSASWTPQVVMPLALWINMLVVNVCFLPSSLRVWQVVVASSKGSGFKRGLWQATILIALVSVFAIVISRSMFGILGKAPEGLGPIFAHLANDSGPISSYFVYPFFIAALLSALVSTADSAVLPLAQMLSSGKSSSWKPSLGWRSILLPLVFSIIFYFIVTKMLGLTLVPWILTVFSITTCVAPVVVIPLFMKPRRATGKGATVISAGAMAGFILALLWSVYFKDDLAVQPWNCVISFVLSAVATWIGLLISDRIPLATESHPSTDSKAVGDD